MVPMRRKTSAYPARNDCVHLAQDPTKNSVTVKNKQEDIVNLLIETKRTELIRLCAQYHVRRLELFGSATGAHFDPDTSDLDFLVEFQDLSPRDHADAFFGLMEELQQIFGRPVELVEWRAIRNPYFLQAVEQTRMLLYAAA
jgi:predicted nucleotidyltransferase